MASTPDSITAIKVKQWLNEWDDPKIDYNIKHHRRKPKPNFYVFSLSAKQLRQLSGIYRRSTNAKTARAEDLSIQRRHDVSRSKEIREYLRFGFPWSDLNDSKRQSGKFDDLRKPGWLPSAIVINILGASDERAGQKIAKEDLIEIVDKDLVANIILPKKFGKDWKPKTIHPLEIIDGQHRLFAFDHSTEKELEDFQLPVVAFHELDISWQAYLFWTINIKPTKINTSLAYDLYPLLRTEDWLDRFEGHPVYREVRAQELTEAMWGHPESPWHNRINMLGEPGIKNVRQAAWIRALTTTFVRHWSEREKSVGGLFGAPVGEDTTVLPWNAAQQAAFLILLWKKIKDSVGDIKDGWAKSLRSQQTSILDENEDAAFSGSNTLLNTDQGVRGVLAITNDLFFLQAKTSKLNLKQWFSESGAKATDKEAVTAALASLAKQKSIFDFIKDLAEGLASFDWRTSSAEQLTQEQRTMKLVFRGSSGYRELKRQLMEHLSKEKGAVGTAAKEAYKILFN